MITAEQKPIEEIREMIAPYKRILVLGCGSCVAECAAGGEKETAMLASTLRMAAKMHGEDVLIEEKTLDRQCVKDFVILLDDIVDRYDAILSLGCGAGVQAVAEMFSEVPIIPALNTEFLGETRDQGFGGSREGKCEVNPDVACAWQVIIDRLAKFGELDRLEKICPPKDWSKKQGKGPRKIMREDQQK
jgi:ferredoxin